MSERLPEAAPEQLRDIISIWFEREGLHLRLNVADTWMLACFIHTALYSKTFRPQSPASTPAPQPELDELELAEKWLLIPEHNVGQETKHAYDCGRGVSDPRCELCRLSIMLPAYAKYRADGKIKNTALRFLTSEGLGGVRD